MSQTAFVENVVFHPTRLELADVELDDWKRLAEQLGNMARSHQWWIGDLLVYGETAFDEEIYYQAVIDFGLSDKTLLNYRSICARVDPKLRRESLSFSIHAAIAYLERADQVFWLDRCEKERLTVVELRELLAATRPEQGTLALVESEEDVQRRIENLEALLRDATDIPGTGLALPGVALSDLVWLVALAKKLTRGGS